METITYIPTRVLRSSDAGILILPKVAHSGETAFSYCAARLWNTLSNNISSVYIFLKNAEDLFIYAGF